MTVPSDDIPAASDSTEQPIGFWAAYGAILVCLIVTGILTSGRLLEIAERQPLGSVRRVMLIGAAGGVHALAQAAGADRPARLVDSAMGRGAGSASRGPGSAGGSSAGSSIPGRPGDAAAGIFPAPTGMFVTATPRDWTYFPTPGPSPTPTLLPLRPISPDAPLELLVVGDSFAQPLAFELTNLGAAGGMVNVAIDARISTGITRPDYFDWPAQLAAVAAAAPPPEAVVIFMGANDDQNMVTESGVVQLTTPEWRAEYRRRVDSIVSAFADRGTVLYWVGLPVMQDPFENQVAMDINDVLRAEAAERPWLRYVDIWPTFGDAGGGFAMYLPDATGEMVHVRQNDGVHLTRAGSDQVAALTYERLYHDWDLTPPTPTPEPTATEMPTEIPTEMPMTAMPEFPLATEQPPAP